jgi:hypothetical protein
LKPDSGRNAFAEAILLIEVHEMKNVLWNRLRARCIECYYQLNGDVLPVERVSDIKRRVGAELMADDDNDVLVPA